MTILKSVTNSHYEHTGSSERQFGKPVEIPPYSDTERRDSSGRSDPGLTACPVIVYYKRQAYAYARIQPYPLAVQPVETDVGHDGYGTQVLPVGEISCKLIVK